jgi:hypothetical protein
MDDQKTMKVDGGQQGAYNAGGYAGQPAQSPYGGGWDATQYAPPDLPTPRPGDVPAWGSQPAPSGAPTWDEKEPQPGGSATMLISSGPKAPPSFAWLVAISGPGNNRMIGQPLPIKKNGATTIGRAPGNDILLPDSSCSSQHAKVKMETDAEGKQVFVIYDLASSNGLYIGDKDNFKKEENRVYRHSLEDGNYLMIGETTLVFKQV